MRIERVPLGSGYLWMDDFNSETLYLAHNPGPKPFIAGIHIPVGAIQLSGELIAIPLVNKGDYLVGEYISLGEGALLPYDRGIRIRSPENTRRNELKGARINRLIRAQVLVSLIFNAER